MKKSDLVYSDDLAAIIHLARAKGFSNEKIITILMVGRDYKERLAIAKKYAPVMGLELAEFMIMAGLRRSRS